MSEPSMAELRRAVRIEKTPESVKALRRAYEGAMRRAVKADKAATEERRMQLELAAADRAKRKRGHGLSEGGKSPRFAVTLTEADLDLLARLASDEGLSMSRIVVGLIREAARARGF